MICCREKAREILRGKAAAVNESKFCPSLTKMSKAKEAEAPAKILKYMVDTNRPYSVVDVMTNLHKQFGKTCVQRTMDQLVADGKLKEKVYGKQKVYVANQANFPEVSEGELKGMDGKIAELQKKVEQSQSECKQLESSLSSLNSSLTSEQAREKLKAVEKECGEMEARLTKIKSGGNAVTPEESARINKEHQDTVRQWRKRKRMATDIVNAVLEGYPKSKKELYEEVGIETDEEYGVKLPA